MATTTIEEIKSLLQTHRNDLAFIIGNGINRYNPAPDSLSWDKLLIKLGNIIAPEKFTNCPKGISLTEFYDIIELENVSEKLNPQAIVAQLIAQYKPSLHHYHIINKIKELDTPILTTNYDRTLAETFDHKLLRTVQKGFTDFYPWSTYHGYKELESPCQGFGIWYINGMMKYHRSIRLGLCHYMGSVGRARAMIYQKPYNSLYSGNEWAGSKTWLDIIFNKALFIFGLGLEENETFLRWLLIERRKYYKTKKESEKPGFYITTAANTDEGKNIDSGKKFFLEKLGIKVIEVSEYKDIYETIWQ